VVIHEKHKNVLQYKESKSSSLQTYAAINTEYQEVYFKLVIYRCFRVSELFVPKKSKNNTLQNILQMA